ncbi:MAG TPA: glycoside hydrolase family 3 N-terminal domain-containing protein [Anaeromyxobacter sp.]|nr:glycoside hydrolase family 3 N-terminal domain-containing protein [Anaeromyxobacter sp.]
MPHRYLDPSRPPEERARDLLARMSLPEKLAQLHALWLILSEDGDHRARADGFIGAGDPDRVREMLAQGLGQISRPLGSHVVEPRRGVRALNRLQKFLREETRLGIPAMSHEEMLVGLMIQGATLFPSALAYGATWNPALVEEAARWIGREARSVGCHQGLAPVLDVSRDVRWGRTEETFGEDPYLVGRMGIGFVRGLQGESGDLLATLKHFAGHSFGEGARNHAPVHLGWRELNDVFLLPFEMVVKQGNARAVMPAYHDIDGEPVHASRHLLTEVLRDRWGFDGLVVADYIGVTLLHEHHAVAADRAEAAALAFGAGLDLELPGADCVPSLREALDRGLIALERIDAAVLRILGEKFRLGLFEHPYTDEGAIELRMPDAVEVAREVARESIVVLENRGLLPLDPASGDRVAVIGPTADDPLALLSGYSFPVHLILSGEGGAGAEGVVTPRAALSRALGAKRVRYARGCHILEKREVGAPIFPGDVDRAARQDRSSPLSRSTALIPEAVDCARDAEVVVACVGDLAGLFQTGTVGEGSDTDSLALPGVQQQLLEGLVATGKPVVVVLTGGRPYSLGGLESRVAAFLWAFAGGQEGGTALAEVLTGAVEPSGRLTVSFPKSAGATPYYYDHKLKSAGTPVALHFGSRYPFGHGLSYTRLHYRDLVVGPGTVDVEGEIGVRFTVENTGPRPGVAVPQLYLRDLWASVVRPVRELKAFGRVVLEPGQAVRLEMVLPVDMLSFTGRDGDRVVEPGEIELLVGPSSMELPLRARVRVQGEARRLGTSWRMTSTCHVVG